MGCLRASSHSAPVPDSEVALRLDSFGAYAAAAEAILTDLVISANRVAESLLAEGGMCTLLSLLGQAGPSAAPRRAGTAEEASPESARIAFILRAS